MHYSEVLPRFIAGISEIYIRYFVCNRQINVIDNMIRMLERHAENLEGLVQERTRELHEEKKKVENLLYNILPRYVHVLLTIQPLYKEPPKQIWHIACQGG